MKFFANSIVMYAALGMFANAADATQALARVGHHHAPAIIHERHGKNATSSNWSGYAVTGVSGSITDVRGSWVVPAIQGKCSSTNQYASFWVGIDGYSSNTVEQIGTDSDCSGGTPTYYAWYEFYPHFAYYVPNMRTISPGDVMSAEVSYSPRTGFTVSITDVRAGVTVASYSTSQKMPNAQRSSAEWIIEAPYSGGILPLANFGTVSFGDEFTNVSSTCYATLGGNTRAIGDFTTDVEIAMVASDGKTVISQPSPLSLPVPSSFTDTYTGP